MEARRKPGFDMDYRNYTDAEFRRLLFTDRDNLELVYEASDRFLKAPEFEEIEATCDGCGAEFTTWHNLDEPSEDIS